MVALAETLAGRVVDLVVVLVRILAVAFISSCLLYATISSAIRASKVTRRLFA
jgi:hypothetical protein